MPDERIRDSLVAAEIAAQAGTDAVPELFLNPALTPIIFGPQRPPLASSGYFPGFAAINTPAVALNTSHAGLFVQGANAASIIRINTVEIVNELAEVLVYGVRRVDDITGFTLVRMIPGYIDAGSPTTGGVFDAKKSDAPGIIGESMGAIRLEANSSILLHGPWIVNQGALVINCQTVDKPVRAYFSYEHWAAIRRQPNGGTP